MSSEAIRVQWGVPDDVPEDHTMAVQVAHSHDGAALRFDAQSDEVNHVGSIQGQVGPALNQHAGILATARDVFGTPARELTPKTLVEVDGVQVALSVAESIGLVRRDESGRYVEATADERRAHEAPSQQDDAVQQPEPFAEEQERTLGGLVRDVPAPILDAVLTDIAIKAAETDDLAVNLEEIVSTTGMTPEAATAFVEQAAPLFQAQARAALIDVHADPDQFLAWARENRPDELKAAIVNHVRLRSTAGYRALAQTYLRNTVPNIEDLRRFGYEARTEAGQDMVKVDGIWMTTRAAARQGRI